MKKLSKYLGIGVLTLALVANMQYAFLSYGLGTNSLSMPLMAQTSSGTGSSSGSSSPVNVIPSGCGTASVHATKGEKNHTASCNCDVSYTFVLSLNPYKAEIRIAHNKGIQNTCSSGEKDDSCDAYGCSSVQI